MATTAARTGYAPVSGLQMYFEIHGSGRPLLLLHGELMTIGGYGDLLPALAADRQVIAVEQQAHGRTGDIDRPLTIEQMADDTAALLHHLGVEQADVLGYSLGSGIALQLTVTRPDLVRKAVLVSATYNRAGFYPGIVDGAAAVTPEALAGSATERAYLDVAPKPKDWPRLVEKIRELRSHLPEWSPEAIESIEEPVLIIVGDSDIVRLEHAVEMFRWMGGGVVGDKVGLPASQLAILPGTTHTSIMQRTDLLLPIIRTFLDAATPEAAP